MTIFLKKFTAILIIGLAVILLSNSQDVWATDLTPEIQVQESWVDYQFEVGIPMIVKAGTKLQAGSLPQYVSMLIYRVIFPASGILGFIMILWAGVEYMLAGGNVEHQKAAQQRIIDALAGLLLLFAFWIILNTINPNILKLPDIGLIMGQYLGLGEGSELARSIRARVGQEPGVDHDSDDLEWEAGALNDIKKAENGDCINLVADPTICQDPKRRAVGDINCNCAALANQETPPAGCQAGQTKLDNNLLTVLDTLTNKNSPIKTQCGYNFPTDFIKAGCNLLIGPFVTNHYYCSNPTSKHASGQAFDLEGFHDDTNFLGTKDRTNPKNKVCQKKLKEMLCVPDNDCGTVVIGGITVKMCDETASNQPHIHIEIP